MTDGLQSRLRLPRDGLALLETILTSDPLKLLLLKRGKFSAQTLKNSVCGLKEFLVFTESNSSMPSGMGK